MTAGISIQLTGGAQKVQPGTVVCCSNVCLPPTCGDISTNYSVLVGGQKLDMTKADSFGFAAHLPFTSTDYSNTELQIQTLYSTLSTGAFVEFKSSPPITSITPNRGQRGTRVIIEGENLLGFGFGKIGFRCVVVGSSEAQLDKDRSDSTHIYARVSSGDAGSTTIAINTTQTIDSDSYHGPYTFLDSLWTQLDDGVITKIIPPARQVGTLRICGDRLLGGGSSVDSITIAEQPVGVFGAVLPSPDLGDLTECVSATVPGVADPESTVSGGITVISDTGATVESVTNFTYAIITSVNPNSGQFGTEVTISGIELLSGYSDLDPIVYLSGIEATLIRASSDIVVGDPANNCALSVESGEPPKSV